MTRLRPRWALSAFALCVVINFAPVAAQGRGGTPAGPQEAIDTAAILKIKDEGFQRSQIMDMMSWLTDVYGPRLTGSPITKKAGDWTLDQFRKWGLANPHYEWWGPFGRGWVNDRTIAQVTAPVAFPVIAYPGAWTVSTPGMVSADVVYVPSTVDTPEEYAPFRGKLKGKVVISAPSPNVNALFNAPASRYTTEQLNAMANPFPVQGGRGGRGGAPGGRGGRGGDAGPARLDLNACFVEEGVAAVLRPGGGNSTGGNVFPGGNGDRQPTAARSVPQLSLTPEHYGRIFRILDKGLPVKMDVEVKNTFYSDELRSFNIIAEIPGTDKADEVVMLGAHFDSWHSGTGATDNAAGSTVMMEAMRILKTLNLPMRLTVRIGL